MKGTIIENATPLYSMQAEKSVLGAALMDNTVINGSLSSLSVNDFGLTLRNRETGVRE
jgi:replicative DNA helicase